MNKIKLFDLNIQNLKKIFDRMQNKRILVIGEIMADEFIIGNVTRINPEAPVPVVLANEEYIMLGGAGNVLNNIVSLGGLPEISTVIGEDEAGKKILKMLEEKHVPTKDIIIDKKRPTIRKTRIIAVHQHVVRIDREDISKITKNEQIKIYKLIEKKINSFDAIIISDYNKGVITKELTEKIIKLAINNKKIISVDPKPKNFAFYKGVSLITPNKAETEAVWKKPINSENDIIKAGNSIRKKYKLNALLITLGKNGMALFKKNVKPVLIETTAKEVFDVTGAGDTVISAFTMALCAGANYIEAAFISNIAAGIVVGKRGTASATIEEIKKILALLQ